MSDSEVLPFSCCLLSGYEVRGILSAAAKKGALSPPGGKLRECESDAADRNLLP